MKKNDKLIEQLHSSGISIEQLNDKKISVKDNFYKCLWNGIIIFLFVYGIIGFFLDSFSLPFNNFKLITFTAFISLFFALFYLRKVCFNLGYIFILFFIIYYSLRNYIKINSGYSAVLNLIIVAIDKELNLSNLREFNEMYTDRYISITSCFILIAIVLACLFNMWVSRRNSPVFPLIIIIPVIEFSIYLNDDFSFFYLFLILLAFTLFIFARQSDENPVNYKKKQRTYKRSRKTIKLLDRVVEQKWNLIFAGIFCLITLFVSLICFTFVSKTYLNTNSELKKKSDVIVSNVAMNGFSVLFKGDDLQGSGGMNNGTFGDVGTITFDNQTDLEVSFVPYSTDPVYIPSFYANVYDSVSRKWSRNLSYEYNDVVYKYDSGYDFYVTSEYYQTNQLLQSQDDYSASGYMVIENVAAGNTFPVRLYYSEEYTSPYTSQISLGSSGYFKFTPSFYNYNNVSSCEENESIFFDELNTYAERNYLDVPSEVKLELEEICKNNNFGGSTDEIIDQITEFLEDNYQYTLSPGKTPEGEDFVLYFLNEQKKGFCVHFASSACLLLRTMGIPAKYVEGYCFDYTSYDDATLYSVEHPDSSLILEGGWYNGYNELSFYEPISIDITDANAHAWVEVYFEDYGWMPVEFTVGAMADEEGASGLSSMLMGLINTGGNSSTAGQQSSDGNNVSNTINNIGRMINNGLKNLVLIVLILIALFILIKKVIMSYRLYYSKEDNRAVNQYRYLVKLIKKDLVKKYKNERADIEKKIISHSELINILSSEYDLTEISAGKIISRYEEFNYSDHRNDEDIKNLTNSFKYLTGVIISRYNIFKRLIYKIYLL